MPSAYGFANLSESPDSCGARQGKGRRFPSSSPRFCRECPHAGGHRAPAEGAFPKSCRTQLKHTAFRKVPDLCTGPGTELSAFPPRHPKSPRARQGAVGRRRTGAFGARPLGLLSLRRGLCGLSIPGSERPGDKETYPQTVHISSDLATVQRQAPGVRGGRLAAARGCSHLSERGRGWGKGLGQAESHCLW